MSLADLVAHATDKERFPTLEQYIAFCSRYLEFGKHKAPAMASETESGTRLRVPESGRKYEALAMASET